MDLSPSEIRSQSFSRSLRGCNPQEVESFLERTADRVESLLKTQESLEERVEKLESKLDEIGDATGKIRSAKSELSQRRSDVEREEKTLSRKRRSLAQKEEELEAQRAEILQIVSRLQGMMRREANNLQDLSDPSAPTPSEKPSTEGTSESGEREKSTQEWIDSLFPNRLGAGDAASANRASKQNNPGANKAGSTATSGSSSPSSESRSQFEAIKEDVQGRNASESSSSPASSSQSTASSGGTDEEEDKPSTSELERIWDIFDES